MQMTRIIRPSHLNQWNTYQICQWLKTPSCSERSPLLLSHSITQITKFINIKLLSAIILVGVVLTALASCEKFNGNRYDFEK